jgi:hypothetical protein
MTDRIEPAGELFFLDPTGQPAAPTIPYTPRLEADATPARMMLLSNGFTDSAVFLEDAGAELAQRIKIVAIERLAKSDLRGAGAPMTETQIETVCSASDIVVAGVGHCGSCTAAIVRGAVSIAERGLPVVVMVTERFAKAARFTALAAGMPEVPIVIVPHPIAGESKQSHQEIARAVAPALIAALRHGLSCEEAPQMGEHKAAA